MFHRILMPVDLSDKHEQALNTAIELCRKFQGDVTLLHVVEVIAGLSVEEERPFYDRLERMARAHLERMAQRLEEAKVRYQIDVRLGGRLDEIVRCAQEKEADLIILTAPRPNPEKPLAGWGSLSYRIGLLVSCPMLLVR